MRLRWLALLAACGVLGGGCPSAGDESDEGVLDGACDPDAIHCVDGGSIQFCNDGAWSEPAECLPETTGEPPLEVELQTVCTDDGCRPGG
jgi:hypothetical protein